MNTDIGPPSFPSTAARPPRANSKPSSKPSSNPPAKSPDVSTGQVDIPEAAVTTIRGNQSRNIRRELRCRGSMVMIPSTSGSYSVPCPLPKIRTKMFVSIGPRECVVTVELDSNAVLTSLLASCELVNELVRLSYERVLVVDRLQELAPCVLNPADSIKSISRSMEQMPLDDAAENEDEDDCEYEVTTRVEHTFRFPTAFYVLEAIRVKQMESVVYIHVPRSDINVVSK